MLEGLVKDPRPHGASLLGGQSKKTPTAEKLWRFRVGRYRIVYAIDDGVLVVVVVRVGDRRDVYRLLGL